MKIAGSTALVTGANRGFGRTWPPNSPRAVPPSGPAPATRTPWTCPA